MKYTPYLDEVGITFKDDVPEHAVNIIDNLLRMVNHQIDWGEYKGKKRKPCPEQPLLLTGMPIGQYHCPICGIGILAAIPHLAPDDDYEIEYGHNWPLGYES